MSDIELLQDILASEKYESSIDVINCLIKTSKNKLSLEEIALFKDLADTQVENGCLIKYFL